MKENLMYQFELDELGIMGAMLAKSLDFANEQDAPTVIIATLESALDKLQVVIDARCEEHNAFVEITESLDDLSDVSQAIIKNPEVPTPDYN